MEPETGITPVTGGAWKTESADSVATRSQAGPYFSFRTR